MGKAVFTILLRLAGLLLVSSHPWLSLCHGAAAAAHSQLQGLRALQGLGALSWSRPEQLNSSASSWEWLTLNEAIPEGFHLHTAAVVLIGICSWRQMGLRGVWSTAWHWEKLIAAGTAGPGGVPNHPFKPAPALVDQTHLTSASVGPFWWC